MQNIYIAKPGGQKQGPYTLEQINRDLASKKISDTDFWAWHEGLPSWMPLHSVPGVSVKAGAAALPEAKPQPATSKAAPEPVAPSAKSQPTAPNAASAPVPVAKSESEKPKVETTPPPRPEPLAPKPMPQPITPAAKPQPTPIKTAAAIAPVVRTEPEKPKAEAAIAPVARTEPEKPKVEATIAPVARTEPEKLKVETSTAPAVEPEPEKPKPETTTPPVAEPKPEAVPVAKSESAALTAQPEPKLQEILTSPSMSSGKPFAALEQIFVFTTGEGPSAFKSEATKAMLVEAVGETMEHIRTTVPVDVVGGADAGVLESIRAGSIPGSAWRALFKIKPDVTKRAQEGVYHLCIRTFTVESKELVTLFLLYNKQNL